MLSRFKKKLAFDFIARESKKAHRPTSKRHGIIELTAPPIPSFGLALLRNHKGPVIPIFSHHLVNSLLDQTMRSIENQRG